MQKMEADFLPLTSLYDRDGKVLSSISQKEEGLMMGTIEIPFEPPNAPTDQ
jgi:hypothetical protein